MRFLSEYIKDQFTGIFPLRIQSGICLTCLQSRIWKSSGDFGLFCGSIIDQEQGLISCSIFTASSYKITKNIKYWTHSRPELPRRHNWPRSCVNEDTNSRITYADVLRKNKLICDLTTRKSWENNEVESAIQLIFQC